VQTASAFQWPLYSDALLLIATGKTRCQYIYNFKNTYCGSDVSIQNKTNTDNNKYKSLESLHVSSCDFELICLTLYFAFLPYKFKMPLFHYLETLQNVRMTGAYLNAIPGKAFLRKKLDSLTRSLL
jgi:hypothetical protein